jgi:hypothetical protein
VLFVWGAICWIALPHHHDDFRALPKADEDSVSNALAAANVRPAQYALPHFANYGGMKDPALAQRYERGPNATIIVSAPGPCMAGSTFVKGFVLDLVAAFAAAVVYHYATTGMAEAWKRVAFFAGVGALVHGFPALQQVVWMKGPLRTALTHTFDGVVGFVLLALTFDLVL